MLGTVSYSNFVPRYLRYSTTVTLKPGLGVTQGHRTNMYRSATYDFLLTFHSNHGPTSYRFRDKRRYQSKIAKFSHPCILCAPADEVPLELGIGAWRQKLE